MRKYQGILFAALFCFAMLLLLAAGLWWYRPRRAEPVPGRVYESERMPENNAVLNPEPEVAEKQSGYCLTAEDGMLLIFDGTSGEVCFQTHMPLSEFSGKTAGRSLVRHNDGCVSLSGVFQQLDVIIIQSKNKEESPRMNGTK